MSQYQEDERRNQAQKLQSEIRYPVLGKDPQPGRMRNFVRTFEDNGGVHINSGIPNRAFYLATVALGGQAWEGAGRVWNASAIDPRLKPDTDFRRFARLTLRNAISLYGAAMRSVPSGRPGAVSGSASGRSPGSPCASGSR